MDKSKVYCTKHLENDTVECYDRNYQCLGTVDTEFIYAMSEDYRIVQIWPAWTGGKTHAKGYTIWWSTYE